jgi:Spy/CpxP family protein refolding chaperone
MSVNQLVPVPAPQQKRRLRGFLYAATLLLGGGVIGAVVVGPTLGQGPGQGQGPDGPRWQRGWSDNQDDAYGRAPGQRGFGMRERDDGPRMGWRDHDGPRMGWRGGDMGDRGGERMGGRGFGMMFPGAIERRVNRVLGAVDASTEQRQKVRSILEAAGNDLYPIRQQRMENRRQIREALAAATIDRAKIESLRQAQLKLHDSASKRLTDAITDAAEVLTPAQRAELAKRMERGRG